MIQQTPRNRAGIEFFVGEWVEYHIAGVGARRSPIKRIELDEVYRTHWLVLEDAARVPMNDARPCPRPEVEPPKKPARFVKFNTSGGDCFIDLEEVACMFNGGFAGEQGVSLLFKGGATVNFNNTFRDDLEKALDAWMEFKNRQ